MVMERNDERTKVDCWVQDAIFTCNNKMFNKKKRGKTYFYLDGEYKNYISLFCFL